MQNQNKTYICNLKIQKHICTQWIYAKIKINFVQYRTILCTTQNNVFCNKNSNNIVQNSVQFCRICDQTFVQFFKFLTYGCVDSDARACVSAIGAWSARAGVSDGSYRRRFITRRWSRIRHSVLFCIFSRLRLSETLSTRSKSLSKMLRISPSDPIDSDWSNTGLIPKWGPKLWGLVVDQRHWFRFRVVPPAEPAKFSTPK